MTSFREQLQLDTENVFFNLDEFAELVEYKGNKIKAILTIGYTDARGNLVATDGTSDRAVIEVMVKDAPSPSKKETFKTEQGVVWKFGRLLNSDEHTHQIELLRNENPHSPGDNRNPYLRS
jgi:hypothetical protein